MMYIDSYGVGNRAKNEKLKILMKVLRINGNLLTIKMGLKAKMIRLYNAIGKKLKKK